MSDGVALFTVQTRFQSRFQSCLSVASAGQRLIVGLRSEKRLPHPTSSGFAALVVDSLTLVGGGLPRGRLRSGNPAIVAPSQDDG
ncbi:MAG: hypothetical protein C0518_15050 [Opitutus sp.]|nr:hypothetical protein [Opitutus sp.]